MTKDYKINNLYDEIINKEVCAELKNQATQLVRGRGSLNAKIVLIGEAPGKNEDLKGQPFVGASGKFLDMLCESAGINDQDIFITNIVKYRPPNNRDPKPDEKRDFWPFLEREIDIIQPQAIFTLGRHSMEAFLDGLKISDIHGQVFNVEVLGEKYKLVPLYHPAAALYNGGLRQMLVQDFQKAVSLLD